MNGYMYINTGTKAVANKRGTLVSVYRDCQYPKRNGLHSTAYYLLLKPVTFVTGSSISSDRASAFASSSSTFPCLAFTSSCSTVRFHKQRSFGLTVLNDQIYPYTVLGGGCSGYRGECAALFRTLSRIHGRGNAHCICTYIWWRPNIRRLNKSHSGVGVF